MPLPPADEVPPEDLDREQSSIGMRPKISEQNLNSLTVPISSRAQSYNSDSSANLSPSQPSFFLPPSSPASGSTLLRGRAKTLASLTTSSKNLPQIELQPREVQLPSNPYINGQPIEAYLYKDASECPICFLYYPPYLNRTRCCDQPICSECFVQIKRPDPHPPEHADPSAPPRPPEEMANDADQSLVSEPSACPFCVQPEFGVTFDPAPIRRGLAYANHPSSNPLARPSAAMSSSSSVASIPTSGQLSPQAANRRRTTSLSATAPQVITTDRVRPDWATKLASARAHAARRSAAATALHTAAYLMNNRTGSPDSRGFSGFSRRNVLRRGIGGESPSSGNSSSNLTNLAFMPDRHGQSTNTAGATTSQPAPDSNPSSMTIPPRQSSRRNRMEDLEEMMMMEAIRLSLASEEERRKREEKEAKKEAKKKEKEDKKAEKVARKGGMYSSSANPSSGTLDSAHSGPITVGKGKGVAQATGEESSSDLNLPLSRSAPHLEFSSDTAQTYLERSRANLNDGTSSPGFPSAPYRPSHLRTLSNASSSSSSIIEFAPENVGDSRSSLEPSPNVSGLHLSTPGEESSISSTPAGGGAGTEPMFNFRSLAAIIDEDKKREQFVEYADNDPQASASGQGGESSKSAAEPQEEKNPVDTSKIVGVPAGMKDEGDILEASIATLMPDPLQRGTDPPENDEGKNVDAIEPTPSATNASNTSGHDSKAEEVKFMGNDLIRETGSV